MADRALRSKGRGDCLPHTRVVCAKLARVMDWATTETETSRQTGRKGVVDTVWIDERRRRRVGMW